MKTKVEIKTDVHQCQLKKGEKGYIDGYVRAADNRGYAVVVVGERLDFVPLYSLKVLQ
jgi:sugar lactone lactonase YvrE